MCWCFDNFFSDLIICVCVFSVFCIFSSVFFYYFVYVHLFLFVLFVLV